MDDHVETNQGISVIGLGAMGSGIARTFIDAGYRVAVWNRSSDKMAAVAALGATPCTGPRDALDANTHTVVCVADYSVWKMVIEEHDLKEAFHGKCIIQLTGGTIDEVREHAAFTDAHGGRVADGAVMCFPAQLGTGDASLLVSGSSDVLEECDSFLRALDPAWTNLGDDITKPAVLSRALTAGILASLVGYVNGIAICQAAGISLDVYMQQVDKSNAIVPAEKRRLAEAVRDGQTEKTQASIETWAGAHQTIHTVAGTLGTNLVLQDAVKEALQEAQRMGLGDHDLSALARVFAPTHDR